ncbi:uncharacterized protein SPSC_00706 [Sporisorium scitamineum]|uniref:BZIP domain-containing protein n=2 Tax=Sporisorium scitamineum TaxID=49012 RepID=A0A127Z7M8_9BASI|nr:uncharacterized protein SPSC_00706 [Sporisorium scitamineum]
MTTSEAAAYVYQHSRSSKVDGNGTSRSHSFEDGQSGVKSQDWDASQSCLHDSPCEELQAVPPFDTDSMTPNTRTSRMFRERRKERERILRETVAELAERNAALEALLSCNGIIPPVSTTLRHELSLHRSQRLGGPPIHIPGLTPTRLASIPSITEPKNHHGCPLSIASRTRDVDQSWLTLPYFESTSSGHTLPHDLDSRSVVGRSDPSVPFQGRHPSLITSPSHTSGNTLHIPAEAVGPTSTASLRGLRPLTHLEEVHDADRHERSNLFPRVLFPEGRAGPTSRQPPITVTPDVMPPPLPPTCESSHHIAYTPSTSGTNRTTVGHSRTPSDSALLARMPTLTPAEQRVIAARSEPFLRHHFAIPTEGATMQDNFGSVSSSPQPQWPTPQLEFSCPHILPHRHDTRVFPPGLGVSISADRGPAIVETAISRQQVVPSASLQNLGQGFPHPEPGRTPAPLLFPPLSSQSRLSLDTESVSEVGRSFVAHSVQERERKDSEGKSTDMNDWSRLDSTSVSRSWEAAQGRELQARSFECPSSMTRPRGTKSGSV